MKVAVLKTGPGVICPTATDEFGAQERQQNIAAAEEHRANLDEGGKDGSQRKRHGHGGSCGGLRHKPEKPTGKIVLAALGE
jgi:hypothetical protein